MLVNVPEGKEVNKIEVGDLVKVVGKGRCYNAYSTFMSANNLDISKWEKYRHVTTGFIGKVTFVGEHLQRHEECIVLIESELESYIVGIDGVELVEKRSSYHVHHDLIVAWAKGAKIEYFSKHNYKWMDTSNPTWCESMQYRIKPEKTKKELKIEEIEGKMRELADELATLKNTD